MIFNIDQRNLIGVTVFERRDSRERAIKQSDRANRCSTLTN